MTQATDIDPVWTEEEPWTLRIENAPPPPPLPAEIPWTDLVPHPEDPVW